MNSLRRKTSETFPRELQSFLMHGKINYVPCGLQVESHALVWVEWRKKSI